MKYREPPGLDFIGKKKCQFFNKAGIDLNSIDPGAPVKQFSSEDTLSGTYLEDQPVLKVDQPGNTPDRILVNQEVLILRRSHFEVKT